MNKNKVLIDFPSCYAAVIFKSAISFKFVPQPMLLSRVPQSGFRSSWPQRAGRGYYPAVAALRTLGSPSNRP